MRRDECLTADELKIVADALAADSQHFFSPTTEELCQRYREHVSQGCIDCAETIEALQIISEAAEIAIARVISRMNAEQGPQVHLGNAAIRN